MNQKSTIPDLIHNRLLAVLKEYLVVGGLPEVVNFYRREAFEQVRTLHRIY